MFRGARFFPLRSLLWTLPASTEPGQHHLGHRCPIQYEYLWCKSQRQPAGIAFLGDWMVDLIVVWQWRESNCDAYSLRAIGVRKGQLGRVSAHRTGQRLRISWLISSLLTGKMLPLRHKVFNPWPGSRLSRLCTTNHVPQGLVLANGRSRGKEFNPTLQSRESASLEWVELTYPPSKMGSRKRIWTVMTRCGAVVLRMIQTMI